MHIRYVLFLHVLFLVALPATASAQSVAILGLDSNYTDTGFEYPATSALRRAARDADWPLSEGEPVLVGTMSALECQTTPPDRACLERIAEHMHVSEVVYGTTTRVPLANPSEYELEVRLYRFSQAEHAIVERHTARISPRSSDEALASFATIAIAALTASHPIVPPPVVPPPVVASVPIDEDETGASTEPRSAPVDSSDFPELDQPPAAPSLYNHEWAGWTLIGLGAALVLADIPVWVRLNDMNSDPSLIDYRHRLAFGATGDACTNASAGNTLSVPGLDPMMASAQVDHVRGLCSEAATLEIVQYVLPILGALVGATGATLLATGVLVSPSASADHATLTVSGSF